VAFFRIDWIAGVLFLPYITWVTIASALNASVLRRNPTLA
jgi:tryptophan-rich sensory protein